MQRSDQGLKARIYRRSFPEDWEGSSCSKPYRISSAGQYGGKEAEKPWAAWGVFDRFGARTGVEERQRMKIIMLGAPGAGKGTQAKMIAEKYGIPHVSTGDIFRANIKNGTELGREAKQYMDQGLLVPDELTVKILLDRVAQADCAGGYVLDGFPRTIPQAEVLDGALAAQNERIDYAIDVDVPDENIVRRMSGRRACLKCGATYHVEHIPPKKEGVCDSCGSELVLRDDDRAETVLNRLKVYHDQTQPLIDYYTQKKILKTVDGTMDMQDVFHAITDVLG